MPYTLACEHRHGCHHVFLSCKLSRQHPRYAHCTSQPSLQQPGKGHFGAANDLVAAVSRVCNVSQAASTSACSFQIIFFRIPLFVPKAKSGTKNVPANQMGRDSLATGASPRGRTRVLQSDCFPCLHKNVPCGRLDARNGICSIADVDGLGDTTLVRR